MSFIRFALMVMAWGLTIMVTLDEIVLGDRPAQKVTPTAPTSPTIPTPS